MHQAARLLLDGYVGLSNSFFGLAYITLMPVFAVDILEVGADGQGLLMSVGGVGALLATIWLSSRGRTQHGPGSPRHTQTVEYPISYV